MFECEACGAKFVMKYQLQIHELSYATVGKRCGTKKPDLTKNADFLLNITKSLAEQGVTG